MRKITVEDLGRVWALGEVEVRPKGDVAAFVAGHPNLEEDTYFKDLFLVNLKGRPGPHRLTFRGDVAHPSWSPDGEKLLFVSKAPNGESGLWCLPVETGGEAALLTSLPGEIRSPKWSPDGKIVIFIGSVEKKEDTDVKVIRSIPIWLNGKGYVYNRYDHLFLLDLKSGQVRQLTEGPLDVAVAEWSPDGRRIALATTERGLTPMFQEVCILDLELGKPTTILPPRMNVSHLLWEPDGEGLLLLASTWEKGRASNFHLWRLSWEGELKDLLEGFDLSVEGRVRDDVSFIGAGTSIPPRLQIEENALYLQVPHHGHSSIYRVSLDSGNIEETVAGDRAIGPFDVGADGIAFVSLDGVSLPELWYKEKDGTERRLTSFNQDLMGEVRFSKPEKFSFAASDGVTVEGWIIPPLEKEEGKRYPSILEIHGGPKGMYGEGFMFEFQLLAAEGFCVFYVNPRGSNGYGEGFADAVRGHYGERDYQDLMEAVDYVCRNYPFVDPDRLGVTGISYGGFMTNWIVGHTDRFKAAVAEQSISNWHSKFGTTDIGFWFNRDQIGAGQDIFSAPELYLEKSPLTYAPRICTPLLIIHSDADYRCWLDQAVQLFTALKYLNRETELLIFPGEHHSLSIVGKPRHRVERLKRKLAWFRRYLGGEGG
ncbi:MAG: Acylamino-acid-releasing enzyme [Acetothermia bacterium 64_32]|nr:MAG: Acylamino-acid-releasing enzyme [Acetothermia bacterium 64_32]HAF71383.1 S9 family peptidase [Candidatus Acetothermia bacterium]